MELHEPLIIIFIIFSQCYSVYFIQLLGIALRSDVPLALDILPSFWKSILGIPLEDVDLYDADILTYNYIRRLSKVHYNFR